MGRYFRTDESAEEYGTPQQLFNELDAEFHFTVDAAASDLNHKCERYYTKQDDGLSKDWTGETVWCNPPYGRKIGDWLRKGFNTPNCTTVFLIPARTGSSHFHDYVWQKHEVRFLRGRLKFLGGGGTNAPFDSMIVIMRNGDMK